MIVAVCLAWPAAVGAQAFLKLPGIRGSQQDFRSMARQIDMFYDTATGSNRSGYKQWKRWEWFAIHHLDQKGQLADYEARNMEVCEGIRPQATDARMIPYGNWVNLGHASSPGDGARQGRVNSFAFDPINADIVYAATTGGGLWKSYNRGDTWTNLTLDLPILGFADIVVSPAPFSNILYALSGDISGGANIYFHYSIGVIKSYDGGATWTRTNLTFPLSNNWTGYKLLMNPNNSNDLLAATSNGIYRTMNGGVTWTLTIATGNVNDMEYKPGDPTMVYYVVKNNSNLFRFNLTANTVTPTLVPVPFPADRMEIGVTAANVNAVYVLAGPGYKLTNDPNNYFNGLYYSGNAGVSFSLRSNTCSGNGDLFNASNSLSWYANTLLVDPVFENTLLIGGLNLFSSSDGGITLSQVTNSNIHSDQHNLKRNPANNELWLGNDGGAYRSSDQGANWVTKSNDLVINEYYRISNTHNTDDWLLGGTQDNGHFRRDPVFGFFWHVLDGDGMDNYFNSFDQLIVYACTQNGGLKRSPNGGESFNITSLPNAGNSNFYPWVMPIVQHPPFYNGQSGMWENTDVIYAYSLNGVLRCINGLTWDNIGPAGAGNPNLTPSMGICQDAGGTNLYACNSNQFWVCFDPLNAGPNAFIARPLPISGNTVVSAMAVNPANRNEVWVTIAGYQAGVKVFRTQDAGLTWSNLSLSLPNVPVYSIAFANIANSPSGAVYIGTEVGVYYTDDGLPDWVPFYNGLPHVPVTDIDVNYFLGKVKLATYGRGIWESDVYSACDWIVGLYFPLNQGQYAFESSNLILANSSIQGGMGTQVRLKAASQIKFTNGFHIYPDSYLHAVIGNCGTGPVPFQDSTLTLPPVSAQPRMKAKKE